MLDWYTRDTSQSSIYGRARLLDVHTIPFLWGSLFIVRKIKRSLVDSRLVCPTNLVEHFDSTRSDARIPTARWDGTTLSLLWFSRDFIHNRRSVKFAARQQPSTGVSIEINRMRLFNWVKFSETELLWFAQHKLRVVFFPRVTSANCRFWVLKCLFLVWKSVQIGSGTSWRRTAYVLAWWGNYPSLS